MSYKVLYRKYRPDTFEKIVGQKTIVSTLKNSIKNSNFSHAYIFTGPRGTGKTSTAKILAKAINCEDQHDGEICNQCNSCLNIATSPDIIEIDAASNNGVDEIRELRSNITLAPSASKYKIYIIDEVHMLSAGAFNALLKTLEEPPAHAIFILATTEVYKVPITILSRCQRYDFKKIEKDDMINHLIKICNEEKVEFEEEAIEEIFSLSEGCLRDALSILDQTSKLTKKITLDLILENYNIISTKAIEKLLENTFNGETKEVIQQIEEFENSGINAQKLIKKIIKYLEHIAINIKLNKEKRYNFEKIKKLITSLNQHYIDARMNENIFAMIKLSFLQIIDTKDNFKEKKIMNETRLDEQKHMTLVDIRINNCFVSVNKESLNSIIDVWQKVQKESITSLELSDYKPVAASKDVIIFTTEETSLADLFNIKASEIEKLLEKNNITAKVVGISSERWNGEKENYKKRLQSKKHYELIEEPKKIDENIEIREQVNDLFNEKVVEIS